MRYLPHEARGRCHPPPFARHATQPHVGEGCAPWFSLADWHDPAPSGTVALLSTLAQLGQVPAPSLVPALQASGNTRRLLGS